MEDGGLSLIEHYLLLALTGSLIYAALIHPKECYILVYGVIYLFYFPAMYMLLPLYALCNIVDQSWGTRDDVSRAGHHLDFLFCPDMAYSVDWAWKKITHFFFFFCLEITIEDHWALRRISYLLFPSALTWPTRSSGHEKQTNSILLLCLLP